MVLDRKQKMEQMYTLYEASMYAIAYSILNNVEQAEDVTQDSFVKIYSYIDDISDPVSYKTKALVSKIVKNTAIDKYRENKRILSLDDNYETAGTQEKTDTDPAVIIDKYLTELYKRNALDKVLDDMPPSMKQIITMRYAYELKTAEISEILGIGSATVRKRLERARKYLSDRLKDI